MGARRRLKTLLYHEAIGWLGLRGHGNRCLGQGVSVIRSWGALADRQATLTHTAYGRIPLRRREVSTI